MNLNGTVKNTQNKVIDHVAIVLKDSSTIIGYTYTNKEGYFKIKAPTGIYTLSVSSLGYENKNLNINLINDNTSLDIILKEKTEFLDEVIIKSDAPILKRKDTKSVKTKFFVKGNQQTVEDLLQKIPGLNIDDNGTIKVGNQEIEKLMVEGDDFFEKGYKILSKNMPAHPIEEIEILNNFSNNALLKDIEDSDKVALNLKLKKSAKRIWFGNFEVGYGNNNFYEARTNLMNFGKNNKFYFLNNFNSIGLDATGNIKHLIKPFRLNEPASIGDDQSANNLLSLSTTTPYFEKQRSNFNNAELISLNAIFNPSKKLKIKTLGFFNWDETDYYRNNNYTITTPGNSFSNSENNHLKDKQKVAFGKLEINYTLSKNKTINSITRYSNNYSEAYSNLVFNTLDTNEKLNSEQHLFDQKTNYSHRINNKTAFLLTTRFINEEQPQHYNSNQFLFHALFPDYTNANKIIQKNKNSYQFLGIEGHLLKRSKAQNLLEIILGNSFRSDRLRTQFTLLEDNNILLAPENYQNNLKYNVNNTYLKTKYKYKLKDISFIGQIAVHKLYNRLNDSKEKSQNLFFVNPTLGINWNINDNNKISTSYFYNTTNATAIDILENYWITNYRSFSKGTSNFNQLKATSILFNYQLGNWSDRFFANTVIYYAKNHDYFSTNSILNQNYSQSEKILIENRNMWNITSNLDYYIKSITSNLKLNLSFSSSDYKNIVNDSNLRKIHSTNLEYGFEIRSAFGGIFNYHTGTKWTNTSIKTNQYLSYTNTKSFLDLSFIFNKKLQIQLQSEYYNFGNLESNSDYYFLDFNTKYTIKKNKINLSLIGKNLFNTKTFKIYNITDVETSKEEYRLLPIHILFKVEYRF
jgi:hypothetical protein